MKYTVHQHFNTQDMIYLCLGQVYQRQTHIIRFRPHFSNRYKKNEFLEPDRILKSKNATVVFWKDGTKTVVKCAKNEEPNEYNAFTAALAIKLFGTNSREKKIIKNKTVIQEKKGKVK